jgi:hypothetical protein
MCTAMDVHSHVCVHGHADLFVIEDAPVHGHVELDTCEPAFVHAQEVVNKIAAQCLQ